MSKSFSRTRPTFNQFRDWFLEAVDRHSPGNANNPLAQWHSVGEEALRQEIISSFLDDLEMKFGFRPLLKGELHKLDCPLESVANRIFHVFSTMFLVEHINAKMYGQPVKREH
ncbi:MAG TPA: hypothetical protein DEF34_11855 [Desulfotomaculum sp.]|nr:hypothetical protein [Desulfotomaculum sp.]